MGKILSVLLLMASLGASADSVRINVEVDGAVKSGLLYFDASTNAYDGVEYIHLERLRARVGKVGYNIAARPGIDAHICEILGYSYVDYRIIGGGGYDDADANILRDGDRNVVAPIQYGAPGVDHLSLDMMTCAR